MHWAYDLRPICARLLHRRSPCKLRRWRFACVQHFRLMSQNTGASVGNEGIGYRNNHKRWAKWDYFRDPCFHSLLITSKVECYIRQRTPFCLRSARHPRPSSPLSAGSGTQSRSVGSFVGFRVYGGPFLGVNSSALGPILGSKN